MPRRPPDTRSQELRLLESQIHSLVHNAVHATWIAGADGTIRHANGFALEVLRRAGLVGLPQPLATGGTVAQGLASVRRGDGTEVRVAFVSVPIDLVDERGAVVAFTDRVEDDDEAQQASLRRGATDIADDAAALRAFTTIATEIGRISGLALLHILRREPDGTLQTLAAWSAHPPGLAAAAVLRAAPIGAAVLVPVVQDDAVVAVLLGGPPSGERPPQDIEARLEPFARLVASRLADSSSRRQHARLADEQAALRRVAALVARDVPTAELLGAVTREAGLVLGVELASMSRDDDGHAVPVATWALRGDPVSPDGDAVAARVGASITIGGARWGELTVGVTDDARLPRDITARLQDFSELAAMAIDNSETRAQRQRLADEHAALRRVATLVAHEAPADAVFAAVAEELGRLMWSSPTQVIRFIDDESAMVVAGWGDAITPANTEISMSGDSVSARVHRWARPVRISAEEWSGRLGEYALSFGLRWGIGAPILVDGRVWGAMTVVTRDPDGFPPDSEQRVAGFAELAGTAVANIAARADLAASRARVVAAAHEERSRVVRDLHDGAQQRLVHTVITLKLALRELDAGPGRDLVADALVQAQEANDELRDLAHGILPESLTSGGLQSACASVAARMTIPVTADVSAQRLSPAIEAIAYFVIAEAMTNVAKHADATSAAITATIDDERGLLHVRVRDDGHGGVGRRGQGLTGLVDRLAAVDGRLEIDSPPGSGTTVTAVIPLAVP